MKGSDSRDGLKPVHPQETSELFFSSFTLYTKFKSEGFERKIHSENANQFQFLSGSETGKFIIHCTNP